MSLVAGQAGGTVDYYPTQGSTSYDPVLNGGSMTSMTVYDLDGVTPLLTSTSWVKITDGHYRVTFAGSIVSPGSYPATTVWQATGSGPTVTDTTDTVTVVAYGGGVDPRELFDLADLQDCLDEPMNTATATIARRIATSVLTSYLLADPRPVSGELTLDLDVDTDSTVQLPRLLTTIVGVAGVTYVQRGSTLILSRYGSPWEYWPYSTPTVTLTYTYTTVPGAVRDAALITAAALYGTVQRQVLGVKTDSERIDDYQRTQEMVDSQSQQIPALAKDLLRPFRASNRSIRLASASSSTPGAWFWP